MPPPPHTASQIGPQRKTRNAADHLGLSRFCLPFSTFRSRNSRDADEDRECDIIPRRHKRLGRASANPLALQLHTQPPNIIPNLPRVLGETFTRAIPPVYAQTLERSQGKCQFNASTANSRTLLPAHPRPRVLRRSRVRLTETVTPIPFPFLDLKKSVVHLLCKIGKRRNSPNPAHPCNRRAA